MERANKTYGFTIAVKELKETVPNIFRYASAYMRNNNLKSQGLWEMFAEPIEEEEKSKALPVDDPKYKPPLPDEILKTQAGHQGLQDIDPEAMEGEKYNMCHFWSNFEIARLSWFRSKEYNNFFNVMDRSGGFWMERVSTAVENSGWENLTNSTTVGRRPYPFTCGGRLACSPGYPLFPRYWLQAHDHTALPGKRSRQSTATQAAILGDDDDGREEEERGR